MTGLDQLAHPGEGGLPLLRGKGGNKKLLSGFIGGGLKQHRGHFTNFEKGKGLGKR